MLIIIFFFLVVLVDQRGQAPLCYALITRDTRRQWQKLYIDNDFTFYILITRRKGTFFLFLISWDNIKEENVARARFFVLKLLYVYVGRFYLGVYVVSLETIIRGLCGDKQGFI